MINGVFFGTYHSHDDLGLILTKKTIEPAAAKTQTIDIPGADGELDYTEYFGKILYSNRTLSFEFSIVGPPSEFLTLYSRVQNLLHGRKMKIVLDDDPNFYYTGRVHVNEWESDQRVGKLVIDVDAQPYKLKTAPTLVSEIVTGVREINCLNLRMETIPTIVASDQVTVQFGNYSKTFTGSLTDEEIVFEEGQNILKFTPNSASVVVTIEYQEGEL